jgi:hypothetical protein
MMRTSTSLKSLAFAAGCALALGAMPSAHAATSPPAQMITNGPQASRGDFGDWSARRNVAESAQYERLLRTNPAFLRARMRKECGPIGDPSLHQQCMASFGPSEMAATAPMPPRHHARYRHHASANQL